MTEINKNMEVVQHRKLPKQLSYLENSFDLMVESGIGPKKDLGTRKVPISCCKPNDIVGKEIGDEHLVLFMYLGTDKFGSQPKLIAEETYENAYEF